MVLPRELMVLHAPLAQLLKSSALAGNWLAGKELEELALLGDRKRRDQWLAGRWLSKRLIRGTTAVHDLAAIEITTRDQRGRGVRPRVTIAEQVLKCALSIAHTNDAVVVAFAPTDRFSIGVDLVDEVPRSEGFWKYWFTLREREWIARCPAKRGPAAWAMKEAVYKVANRGESWDPRHIEVLSQGRGRLQVLHHGRPLRRLIVKVQRNGRLLRAVACLPTRAHVAA